MFLREELAKFDRAVDVPAELAELIEKTDAALKNYTKGGDRLAVWNDSGCNAYCNS